MLSPRPRDRGGRAGSLCLSSVGKGALGWLEWSPRGFATHGHCRLGTAGRRGWAWGNTELPGGWGGLAERGPGTGDRAQPPETALALPVQTRHVVGPGVCNQNAVSGETDSHPSTLFQESKEFVYEVAEETRSKVFGVVTPGYDIIARLRCVCTAPVGSTCPPRAREGSASRSLCNPGAQLGPPETVMRRPEPTAG